MDNLKGLLGVRRMDRVPNARIRELYGVAKGVDERIGSAILKKWRMIGVLKWCMWENGGVVAL